MTSLPSPSEPTVEPPHPIPDAAGVRGWWLVLLGCLLHVGLGLDAARRWSPTHDEYWHLPAGLAAWREGRFDLDNLNPPLTRLWQAWPLLASGAKLSAGLPPDDAFGLGDRFLELNPASYQWQFLLARGANLLLSALVGICLWMWGRALGGVLCGLIAAGLWLCCPVCLANAAVATPDVGATLLFVATLWSAWRLAREPWWGGAVGVGLLLGGAQLTKFTNILLWAFVPWVWLAVRWRGDLPRIAMPRLTGLVLTVVLTALVTWNAGYLFQGTGRPLGEWTFRSQSLQRLQQQLSGWQRVPVPLPADYLAGFDRQRATMEGSHPVYLDGVWNLQGFPAYYLYCAAYKWPHGTQVWIVLGLALWLWAVWRGTLGRPRRHDSAALRRWHERVRSGGMLLVPAVILVGVASSMGMQLGFRYILPAFPLLYMVSGLAAPAIWPRAAWSQIALGTVVLAALLWGLRAHPHHLAYFNEGSGGMAGGRAHLADSNLDWGQDLTALRDELRLRGIERVALAYFGMVPPSGLGIAYELPPAANRVAVQGRPPAGWYAISVNFVLGRPHTIRNPDGSIRGAGYQEFGYFRRLKPVTTVGGSIDLYHVEHVGR
jgi:4-amino-4-deoxy-L-arabinose transferase-like glycosyltransferase